MKCFKLFLGALLVTLFLSGCTGAPEGIKPVAGFELNKYLGKWYEIARLDHSFERGLEQVTAQYSMREDGGVKVVNSGFSRDKAERKTAEGKAYFVGDTQSGHLKVSFFGPFYGAYVIFELDKEDYQYAFVSGPDRSYLWLLARSPTVSDVLKEKFSKHAGELGFDISKLIFVKQE